MTDNVLTPDARLEPWWWEAAPRPNRSLGKLPKSSDVVIIGAGYTGLSAALCLAREGREVLVLDSGPLGSGASTRNGGMIGSGHRVGYSALTKRYGEALAIDILLEGLASLAFTTELIEREGIDCQYRRCGRFRGAWRAQDYEAMGRERDLMKRLIGLEMEMVPKSEQHREIASPRYHGGCLFPQHGGLHPGLFHQGLLERAETAGVRVVDRTPVMVVRPSSKGKLVVTHRGEVAAGTVIVATNGYTGHALSYFSKRLVPVSSYIVATEEMPAERLRSFIPGGRMIVETRSRHCYYRPSPDGRRLLFGGRAALRAIDPRQSALRLHRLMSGIFPELASLRLTHSWTGFVAMTRDHLPHVGEREGVFYALGYNGSGVAMAPYLGYKVAQQVLGNNEGRTPFERTDFAAIPFYDGSPWFLPFLDGYYRWLDIREGTR